tara:strand:- start:5324 stop:5773 length:450 start_codon:yes stop_codon:yes gene_type:complete
MTEEQIKDLKRIIEDVCEVDLSLNTRKRENINARAIGYKILREVEYQSYHAIARSFNKSHATILQCLKNFKYMLLSDAQMKRNYQQIKLTWEGLAEEYRELKPLEIKKQLKSLEEQNKMLNLCLIDVQKKFATKLKKIELQLKHAKSRA